MNEDELRPSHQAGRFFKEPGDDDEPEGKGCGGAIIGCCLMLVIIGIVAMMVWLFWPGGDKP
jgi:hypothetical protein